MLIYVFLPMGTTIGAALFLWLGLRKPKQILWGYIGIGSTVLVALNVWIGSLATGAGFAGIAAGIVALFVSFSAFVAGIVLAFDLKGKHRIVGGLLALVFPLTLLPSIQFGQSFTSESRAKENGLVIALALNQYRADHGMYPELLDMLVPAYLGDLNEPPFIWGWLYTATAEEFTLGYVWGVDRMGYSACLYSTSNPHWDCEPYSTGPFRLPPTPFP